jgi:hypothetical protein
MQWTISEPSPYGHYVSVFDYDRLFFDANKECELACLVNSTHSHSHLITLTPDTDEDYTSQAFGGMPADALTALGFILAKFLLDGFRAPLRFSRFVVAFLLGEHLSLLGSLETALACLDEIEPSRAARWRRYLSGELEGVVLEDVFGARHYMCQEPRQPLTHANVTEVLLLGCKWHLLDSLLLKLKALKEGFSHLPLSPCLPGLLHANLSLNQDVLSAILFGMRVDSAQQLLSLTRFSRLQLEATIKEALLAFSAKECATFVRTAWRMAGNPLTGLSFDEWRGRHGPLIEFDLGRSPDPYPHFVGEVHHPHMRLHSAAVGDQDYPGIRVGLDCLLNQPQTILACVKFLASGAGLLS